jgi:hypothetical protein
MEWLKPLKGKVVGLDTAPLFYRTKSRLSQDRPKRISSCHINTNFNRSVGPSIKKW